MFPGKTRVRKIAAALAVCIAAAACLASKPSQSPPARPAQPPKPAAYLDERFWAHWSDGKAEVSSYDFVYPRYGAPRQGLAIAIFVTEPFSLESRVKADDGKHPAADVFPVMKLNLAEDFQTGIYDYNEQVSSFLALSAIAHQPAGYLTKVSFSSQEWCGHAWAQWLLKPAGMQFAGHSYFDGEADRTALIPRPPGGIVEEQLFFWARGMAEPRLAPGQTRSVPFRRSLRFERHSHREARWSSAKLSRGAETFRLTVPAGEFQAEEWRAEMEGGPTLTFFVERDGARRLLRWTSTEGEHAALISSARLKYWEMNRPGAESGLSQLGLRQRPARTP